MCTELCVDIRSSFVFGSCSVACGGGLEEGCVSIDDLFSVFVRLVHFYESTVPALQSAWHTHKRTVQR